MVSPSELTFEEGFASLLVGFLSLSLSLSLPPFLALPCLVGVSVITWLIFYLRVFSIVVFAKGSSGCLGFYQISVRT